MPLCSQVIDKAAPTLLDLAEISSLGDHRKLGESIINVLQECVQSQGAGRNSISNRTKEQIEELLKSRQRLKWEKNMPKEDLRIKQAAALVIKLEGNSMFSSGNISAAASKYSEALALCPMRSKKKESFCTVTVPSVICCCSSLWLPLVMPHELSVFTIPLTVMLKVFGEELRPMICLAWPKKACWMPYCS